MEYYNKLANGSCRDAKPFITLLTKTTSREAYSPEEIKLVMRWVFSTWKKRSNGPAKPVNICRVTLFDGYLSDAMAWQKSASEIDFAEVVESYNEILGDRLPQIELDPMAEKQILMLGEHLKDKSADGFKSYFQAFSDNARPYYFGENAAGWRAGFSFLMKPETLVKTRRGEL